MLSRIVTTKTTMIPFLDLQFKTRCPPLFMRESRGSEARISDHIDHFVR